MNTRLSETHKKQLFKKEEYIAKLQNALADALDQNQILRQRVIQLEAVLVASQQIIKASIQATQKKVKNKRRNKVKQRREAQANFC